MKAKNWFAETLLEWNRSVNERQMPWKGEKDPYLVWLSEIILQQTRVEQGLPYFLNFKKAYPTVKKLAAAPEDEVIRLWQGLGYYSRARNLHTTARHIAGELKGKFPSTYDEIVKLKGVGPYTAAAIASFVFGERQAVLDGNVIRVLARIYGISTPFDTTEGKKEFNALAQKLISDECPGEYNQAIMDFGATVCTPANPACEDCPFAGRCAAAKDNLQEELPVRAKRIVKKERFFYYLVMNDEREIIISKRSSNDIWKGLYELPVIETKGPMLKRDLGKLVNEQIGMPSEILKYSKIYTQQLTHQNIRSVFLFVEPADFQETNINGAIRVSLKKLHTFGFPRVVHLFLSENSLL